LRERDPNRDTKKGESAALEIRPWGSFIVLEEKEAYKVKRIEVYPGKRLSYQRHEKRSEHWVVVQGQAIVTLEGKQIPLDPGQSVDIPRRAAHRIFSVGPGPLVFIEIQTGEYFGEDDITRLEDDFGRVPER
jgi:mannose-6-phosphate isomerase-like protein (cupin superfamily)